MQKWKRLFYKRIVPVMLVATMVLTHANTGVMVSFAQDDDIYVETQDIATSNTSTADTSSETTTGVSFADRYADSAALISTDDTTVEDTTDNSLGDITIGVPEEEVVDGSEDGTTTDSEESTESEGEVSIPFLSSESRIISGGSILSIGVTTPGISVGSPTPTLLTAHMRTLYS